MTKRIVLCADDYGQAAPISEGILALLAEQRLTATSCLVNQPYWLEQASMLQPWVDRADVGLHLNFTDGEPLSAAYRDKIGARFMSLPLLMLRTQLRDPRLKPDILAAEIEAQLQAFEAGLGVLPRFIDGHQHIHQFPLMRDALLTVYRQRLHGKAIYIRSVWQRNQADFKSWVIQRSGAVGLQKLLVAERIPFNTSFAGIYDFRQAKNYRTKFQGFLRQIEDNGLMMCHPGYQAERDLINAARQQEWNYLASDQFIEDCQAAEVQVRRFEL